MNIYSPLPAARDAAATQDLLLTERWTIFILRVDRCWRGVPDLRGAHTGWDRGLHCCLNPPFLHISPQVFISNSSTFLKIILIFGCPPPFILHSIFPMSQSHYSRENSTPVPKKVLNLKCCCRKACIRPFAFSEPKVKNCRTPECCSKDC